jgi:hypothetical protein
MKLKIDRIRFHRNGCCGAPFHLVEFRARVKGDRRDRRFLATVFEESGVCAVVQPDNPLNRWRGDHFEDALRAAIAARAEDESVYSYVGTDN